jgi:8-oxo-dGTP pyrophosphatase MutT (NUDIX family)
MNSECKPLDISKIQLLLRNEREKKKEISLKLRYRELKKAAILIPIVCVNGHWSLLFTRRAETLRNHRGQVSFPGGGMDNQDKSPEETALREAHEEIGLEYSDVQIIGNMPDFITISDFLVTPVVCYINWPVPLEISTDEVVRVFTIPIDWLRNTDNWEERLVFQTNGSSGKVIYFNLFDDELLWGISAKITIDLLKILDKII